MFSSPLSFLEVVSSLPSWDVGSQRSLFFFEMIFLRIQLFPVLYGWLLEDQEIARILLSILLLRTVCTDALCRDPYNRLLNLTNSEET
jgi:hypothetical protein